MDVKYDFEPADPPTRKADGLPTKSYADAAHESEHVQQGSQIATDHTDLHHKILRSKHSNVSTVAGPAPVLKIVPDEEYEKTHGENSKNQGIKTAEHLIRRPEEAGHDPIQTRQHSKKPSHSEHEHTKHRHKTEATVNGHKDHAKADGHNADSIQQHDSNAKAKEDDTDRTAAKAAKKQEDEATVKKAEDEAAYARKKKEVEKAVAEAKRKMEEEEEEAMKQEAEEKRKTAEDDRKRQDEEHERIERRERDEAKQKKESLKAVEDGEKLKEQERQRLKKQEQDEEDKTQAEKLKADSTSGGEGEFSKQQSEYERKMKQTFSSGSAGATVLEGLGHQVANLKGEANLEQEFPEESRHLTSTKMPDSYPLALKRDAKEAPQAPDQLVSGKQAGAGWTKSACVEVPLHSRVPVSDNFVASAGHLSIFRCNDVCRRLLSYGMACRLHSSSASSLCSAPCRSCGQSSFLIWCTASSRRPVHLDNSVIAVNVFVGLASGPFSRPTIPHVCTAVRSCLLQGNTCLGIIRTGSSRMAHLRHSAPKRLDSPSSSRESP